MTTTADDAIEAAAELEERVEYRYIVTCTDDPCTYCRAPRHEHVDTKAYDTAEEALEHGIRYTRFVLGTSVHKVRVQEHTVSPWVDTTTHWPPTR